MFSFSYEADPKYLKTLHILQKVHLLDWSELVGLTYKQGFGDFSYESGTITIRTISEELMEEVTERVIDVIESVNVVHVRVNCTLMKGFIKFRPVIEHLR